MIKKITPSDGSDVSKSHIREIIPDGCRQTDLATGEFEDFSCTTCQGGQPGVCDDYPKAQKLLENARVMQQEVGFYLGKVEKIAKEEYDGQLCIVYSHDHWEATLGRPDGKNLKSAASTLHNVVTDLMNEYEKERELKIKQLLYQKIAAMDGSCKLSKLFSELQQKILDAEKTNSD
ncbi:MAG: hypothetical protein AB1847_03890 [bacterium]